MAEGSNKNVWIPILVGIGAFILGCIVTAYYADYIATNLFKKMQSDEKKALEEIVANNPNATVKDLLIKYNQLNTTT